MKSLVKLFCLSAALFLLAILVEHGGESLPSKVSEYHKEMSKVKGGSKTKVTGKVKPPIPALHPGIPWHPVKTVKKSIKISKPGIHKTKKIVKKGLGAGVKVSVFKSKPKLTASHPQPKPKPHQAVSKPKTTSVALQKQVALTVLLAEAIAAEKSNATFTKSFALISSSPGLPTIGVDDLTPADPTKADLSDSSEIGETTTDDAEKATTEAKSVEVTIDADGIVTTENIILDLSATEATTIEAKSSETTEASPEVETTKTTTGSYEATTDSKGNDEVTDAAITEKATTSEESDETIEATTESDDETTDATTEIDDLSREDSKESDENTELTLATIEITTEESADTTGAALSAESKEDATASDLESSKASDSDSDESISASESDENVSEDSSASDESESDDSKSESEEDSTNAASTKIDTTTVVDVSIEIAASNFSSAGVQISKEGKEVDLTVSDSSTDDIISDITDFNKTVSFVYGLPLEVDSADAPANSADPATPIVSFDKTIDVAPVDPLVSVAEEDKVVTAARRSVDETKPIPKVLKPRSHHNHRHNGRREHRDFRETYFLLQ